MRIGIFQDIHGNLPALEKGIKIFRERGCDKIYHVGDLIGIGPYPRECIELCYSIEEMEFIMGNHDYWYAFGLPNPIPEWMSMEEVNHQNWAHKKIGKGFVNNVKEWKFSINISIRNKRITFQHYGLNKNQNWFKPIIKNPSEPTLDKMFEGVESDIIFYGHQHQPSDIEGRKCRYVNLGSAGCNNKPEVRIGILEISNDSLNLEKTSILYEDNGLMEEFEKRNVPAREFITNVFITRK